MVLDVHSECAGNVMARTLEELEAIVREQMCWVSSDSTVEGAGGLEKLARRLFSQVASAVQSTDSDEIREYIRAIRQQVYSVCHEQAPGGECESRPQVRRSPGRLLSLVIDAIEESRRRRQITQSARNWVRHITGGIEIEDTAMLERLFHHPPGRPVRWSVSDLTEGQKKTRR